MSKVPIPFNVIEEKLTELYRFFASYTDAPPAVAARPQAKTHAEAYLNALAGHNWDGSYACSPEDVARYRELAAKWRKKFVPPMHPETYEAFVIWQHIAQNSFSQQPENKVEWGYGGELLDGWCKEQEGTPSGAPRKAPGPPQGV